MTSVEALSLFTVSKDCGTPEVKQEKAVDDQKHKEERIWKVLQCWVLLLLALAAVSGVYMSWSRHQMSVRLQQIGSQLEAIEAHLEDLERINEEGGDKYLSGEQKLLGSKLEDDWARTNYLRARLRRHADGNRIRLRRKDRVQRFYLSEFGGRCLNGSYQWYPGGSQELLEPSMCEFRVKHSGVYLLTLQLSSKGRSKHDTYMSTWLSTRNLGELVSNVQSVWYNATAYMSIAVYLNRNDYLKAHKFYAQQELNVTKDMSFFNIVKLRGGHSGTSSL